MTARERENVGIRRGGERGKTHLRASVPACLRAFYVGRRGPTLHAFTLIEMLVSLAVISVALAVVGVVFSITTKTASQSAAYSEAHNWVRQFTQQIKEDLRHCDPASSIMVIVGRTQPAALTAPDLEAGKHYRVLVGDASLVPAGYDPEYEPFPPNAQYSDPRADILMFFSKRPTASVAPAPGITAADDPIAWAAAGGVKFSPIRVVYGHAALTDPVWTGTNYRFPNSSESGLLQHIEQTPPNGDWISKIPASRWHLGRVATIIVDPGIPPPPPYVPANAQLGLGQVGVNAWVAEGQWYSAGSQAMPGDVARLSMPALLSMFGPNGANYYAGITPPLVSPYGLYNTAIQSTVDSLVYATGTGSPTMATAPHHVATVLNDVPAELAGNMGVHMLPGCAWFQVEFLMPEDPRNSVEYNDPNPAHATAYSKHSDMPRWTSVWSATPEPATYVFVPDTAENRELVANQVKKTLVDPTDRLWKFARLDQDLTKHSQVTDALSQRIIRLWPYAIRITVRVFDPNGRLDEPIVRTIVHRFE